MPGYDRSGPLGAGTMTGGRRGICNTGNIAYRPKYSLGLGSGRGLGPGRGFRGGYGQYMRRGFCRPAALHRPEYFGGYPDNTAEELDMLKAQAVSVKTTLDTINRRMAELEKTSE